MLDVKRDLFKGLEEKIAKFFSIFPLGPNQWTLTSIIFAFLSSYFLIKQNFVLTILFFLIAGFLDLIDGAVARYKNISTKFGAYLDTICDRYVEAILLFGMFFLPLPKIILPAYFWISLILFGSIMTTYAKAAAKEKELTSQELKGGIFSRGERIIFLLIFLIFCQLERSFTFPTYVLILIAVLTNITAWQRIISALKINAQDEKID